MMKVRSVRCASFPHRNSDVLFATRTIVRFCASLDLNLLITTQARPRYYTADASRGGEHCFALRRHGSLPCLLLQTKMQVSFTLLLPPGEDSFRSTRYNGGHFLLVRRQRAVTASLMTGRSVIFVIIAQY